MISGKGMLVFGLTVILAAIAAPPKLRAGTKIALLLAKHGQPYHVYKAVLRLPALAKVDTATCGTHPTGREACYLTERDDNLGAFYRLEHWHQDNVHEWFVYLQDNGKIDAQELVQKVTGQHLPDTMASMTEDDFKAAIGAGERSLHDEELHDNELYPIFDWTDKDDDGVLSLQERAGILTQDCNEQAHGENRRNMCDSYVGKLKDFMPTNTMNYEQWKMEILSEGASVYEQVSGQFASSF